MLRRQAIRKMRRPLIGISPKSLLRHPLAVSSMDELVNGTFQTVIGEIDDIDPKQVKRVVLCSGKVYYEMCIRDSITTPPSKRRNSISGGGRVNLKSAQTLALTKEPMIIPITNKLPQFR